MIDLKNMRNDSHSPITESQQAKSSRGAFSLFKGSEGRSLLFTIGLLFSLFIGLHSRETPVQPHPTFGYLPDLAMSGGDPHIRALMRTISASESNDEKPYALLYGGEEISHLNQHPDICVPIEVGVNQGRCSTAAGRYQFLNSTWLEKASLYHPNPGYRNGAVIYSFEPKYQDTVTYQWLKDEEQWSADIAELLRQGEISEVFQLLSGTWTSLGFGIEDNLVTPYLVEIYYHVLAEELQQAQLSTRFQSW